MINYPTEQSTTFENIYTSNGRHQIVHAVAPRLDYYNIPEAWRSAPIVHLGPVAQEVEPSLVRNFPTSLIGITPQGWLRRWDSNGRVSRTEWPEARFVLERSGATVISSSDVDHDESRIEEMAAACRVMAVTEGPGGARVYWNGDVRRFRAAEVVEVDPTGAGDIFATAFFARLFSTRDPWEAALLAAEPEPLRRLALQNDRAMIRHYDHQLTQLEEELKRLTHKTAFRDYALIQTVPGIGKNLGLTILHEIGDIRRFPTVKDFLSSGVSDGN